MAQIEICRSDIVPKGHWLKSKILNSGKII